MFPDFDREKCIKCLKCSRVCPMGVIGRDEEGRPSVLPRRRCIGCMHCAAGCPVKAIRFDGIPENELYCEKPDSELQRLVRSRRSVRTFLDRLPPKEDIIRALDIAEYAPSGKNFHATRWSVLWGKEVTERITQEVLRVCEETGDAPELLKLIRHGTNLITCGAPCLIIGWSPDDCLNPVLDTAVAMTTLELLLQEQGLATCWGGYLRQLSDLSPKLRGMLGIPEGCHMRCGLMVGYPKGETYPNIPYRPKAPIAWVTPEALEKEE